MAALMRLHSAKSVAEKDRERRVAILTRPALPSTSTGENGKVKIASAKLEPKSLGIVKRPSSSSAAMALAGVGDKNTSTKGESLPKKPKLLLCDYSSGSSDSD